MIKERKRIGVFMAQPDSQMQIDVMRGLNEVAYANNCDVLCFSTSVKNCGMEEFVYGEKFSFDIADVKGFEGVVVIPDLIQIDGMLDHLEKDILKDYSGTVVYINSDRQGGISVSIDTKQAYKPLVDYLFDELGCRKIAVMTGPEEHEHSIMRREALKELFREKGIGVDEDDIYYGDFWYNKGEEVAEKILEKAETSGMPDVVICANDPMAESLADAFEKRGIRVPEDVILTGFDRSRPCAKKNIISVKLFSRFLGKKAASVILKTEESLKEEIISRVILSEIGGMGNCEAAIVQDDSIVSFYDGDGFDSGFNFMNENLLSTGSVKLLLWTISAQAEYLGKIAGFNICLGDFFGKAEDGSGYFDPATEKFDGLSSDVYLALSMDSGEKRETYVDFQRKFPITQMIPELLKEDKKPSTFYFSILHFKDHIYGYTVLEENDAERYFSPRYAKFIRSIALGFEALKQQYSLRALYKKVEESAVKDQSTGLFSRNGFNLYADQMLERAKAYDNSLIMIYGDLNCLKYINDTFGHSQGDVALKVAADVMKIEFDGYAINGQKNFRTGGDEFVQLIVGDITESEIKAHVARIKKMLDDFNKKSKLPYPVYMSMGYSYTKADRGVSIDDLLKAADDMMFRDKLAMKKETGFDFKRSV